MDLARIAFTKETRKVYREAREIASSSGIPFDTAAILIALFLVESRARELLLDSGLTAEALTDIAATLPREEKDAWTGLFEEAQRLAQGMRHNQVTTVHLLAAIGRMKDTRAYEMLKRSRISPELLRTQAISLLMELQLGETSEEEPLQFPEETLPERPLTSPKKPSPSLGPYDLDPKKFPMLTSLGRNLMKEAMKGGIDPVVGREEEIAVVLDILEKRRSNNPLLIEEPGVGKTALVEGIARMVIEGDPAARRLKDKVIIAINAGDLVAGTALQGSLAQRLTKLKKEMQEASRRVIVFFDEIHAILSIGGGGDIGTSNELKGALARGEFTCIGATTYEEYERTIRKDPALIRRFEVIHIREPSIPQTERILRSVAPYYEEFHGVRYEQAALFWAVRLAVRFIPSRALPDKAIALLDLAGARVKRNGQGEVGVKDIEEAVSQVIGLPREFVSIDPQERITHFKKQLSREMPHASEVLQPLFGLLESNYLDPEGKGPLGVILVSTEVPNDEEHLARVIAGGLLGLPDAVVDIELAEYGEAHTVSNLLGSPPGYVGHEEGGLLAATVLKWPAAVYLWRHVDLADPSVLRVLREIFATGRVKDRRGNILHMENTMHLVTLSNESQAKRTPGFVKGTRSHFSFKPLEGVIGFALSIPEPDQSHIREMIGRVLGELKDRLRKSMGISFEWEERVISLLERRVRPQHYIEDLDTLKEDLWMQGLKLGVSRVVKGLKLQEDGTIGHVA